MSEEHEIESIEFECKLGLGLEEEDGEEPPPEDDYDCSFTANVVRVGPNRLRMAEPVSVTPFGPYGGQLNLGQVVECVPLDDGGFRIVRLVGSPHVWSKLLKGRMKEHLENGEVQAILTEFGDAEGVWEWTAGNLTLQWPLGPEEAEPPSRVLDLVERLEEVWPNVKESGDPGQTLG
jgi:hypothetical protein